MYLVIDYATGVIVDKTSNFDTALSLAEKIAQALAYDAVQHDIGVKLV